MNTFFSFLKKAKAKVSMESNDSFRFKASDSLCATRVATGPHPKFMTDWQSSWTILMTQAKGMSVIHETVYEDRFNYVKELQKMGAKIKFFDPYVKNPEVFYNFNWKDKSDYSHQGIKIFGKTKLHEAILEVSDLRAGATLLIAALTAEGKSTISGIEHIDRGYENISGRLKKLGGKIEIIDE
jgi:UDP-N-acetylglucosamine 1-carboxyvinyltransferase